MKKEALEKLKRDPIKYQQYLEDKRKAFQRIIADPVRRQLRYDKKNEYEQRRWKQDPDYRQRRNEKCKRLNRIRYKTRIFKSLVKAANKHCDEKLVPFDLWKIAKKQNLLCPFTGHKLTKENLSLDHIIPKSKGGLNVPSNIRLTLKDVNMAKQSLLDEDFIKLCNTISSYTAPVVGEHPSHR